MQLQLNHTILVCYVVTRIFFRLLLMWVASEYQHSLLQHIKLVRPVDLKFLLSLIFLTTNLFLAAHNLTSQRCDLTEQAQ